jgi:hypothetical protein
MGRFLVFVSLKSFITRSTSDLIGEGEFYFKCNRRRFPHQGTVHLKKMEEFKLEPQPLMYFAITDNNKPKYKFNISVHEADLVGDDLMIKRTFELPLKTIDEDFEMVDKTKVCALYVHIHIEETRQF